MTVGSSWIQRPSPHPLTVSPTHRELILKKTPPHTTPLSPLAANPSALTLSLPLDPPPPHTTPPSGSTATAPNPTPSLWISTHRRPHLTPPAFPSHSHHRGLEVQHWIRSRAPPSYSTTTSRRRGRGAAPDQASRARPLAPPQPRRLLGPAPLPPGSRLRAQGGPPRCRPSHRPHQAVALLALFLQWGLRCGPMVNSGHPCGTRDWVESFTQDASVGCSCDRLPVCRITHLNITRFWNLTEIPPELVSLLGVLCCCCLIDECCCDPSIIFVG